MFTLRAGPSLPTTRRLDPLDGNSEHISNTALGLDDARCTGIAFELAPEAKNLHVDAAVEDILVKACRLQQVIAISGRCGASRKASNIAYSPFLLEFE